MKRNLRKRQWEIVKEIKIENKAGFKVYINGMPKIKNILQEIIKCVKYVSDELF